MLRLAWAALAFAIIGPNTTWADIVLRCDPPQGKRVSYGTILDFEGKEIESRADGIRWQNDSFSNMYPVFVWKEGAPDKLLVSWGPARLPGANNDVGETILDEATVVYRDADQIHGVIRNCGTASCTTVFYTLFTKLGFATRADSNFSRWLGRPNEGEGNTRIFATTCKR